MLGDYRVNSSKLLMVIAYKTKQETFLLFLISKHIKQKQDNLKNDKKYKYKL
jgi:hypothetical protein